MTTFTSSKSQSAINKDGSLNIALIERQVREDMEIYYKSRAEDGMKKRALHGCKDYLEFKNFVSVSQLKPISGRDVSSLYNGSSVALSSFRNRNVHGAAAAQSGIGCLDGYMKEKTKDDEVIARNDSYKKDQDTAEQTTSSCHDHKSTRHVTKSSRDAHKFLVRWKLQCSSSASDALGFLAEMKDTPEMICEQYFAADIDSDVVGDIVGALHLLMSAAVDKNNENDNVVTKLNSNDLLNEPNTTKFISGWLKAMTGCGRFGLAQSFLTPRQELQLQEIVAFVKQSDDAEEVGS